MRVTIGRRVPREQGDREQDQDRDVEQHVIDADRSRPGSLGDVQPINEPRDGGNETADDPRRDRPVGDRAPERFGRGERADVPHHRRAEQTKRERDQHGMQRMSRNL